MQSKSPRSPRSNSISITEAGRPFPKRLLFIRYLYVSPRRRRRRRRNLSLGCLTESRKTNGQEGRRYVERVVLKHCQFDRIEEEGKDSEKGVRTHHHRHHSVPPAEKKGVNTKSAHQSTEEKTKLTNDAPLRPPPKTISKTERRFVGEPNNTISSLFLHE